MLYSSENMEENYNALLDLPIVKKLIQKNAKLRKENKALKSLIYSLPEFRCVCRTSSEEPIVHVKTEKDDTIPVQCETLVEDDEVVYVAPESDVKKINIVYEIDEEEEDAEEEEEEEEAAEEEEEEEVDEVFVVTVSGKSYYTTNKDSGKIYAIDANEDVGDEIGEFKKGKATFYKK
jgi:hypothetical protein